MKGKIITSVMIFAFCLLIALPVNAETKNITLNITEDTYVNSLAKNTNYGSNNQYRTNMDGLSSWYERSYLKFDISSLPANITVTKVRIRASITQVSNPRNLTIAWLYNQTWEELKVTWNNQPCNNLTWFPTNSSQCITDNPYSNNSFTTVSWKTFYLGTAGLDHFLNNYNAGNENVSYILWETPFVADGFGHYHRFNSIDVGTYTELILDYIEQDTTNPNVTLNSPPNNAWVRVSTVTFNATGKDEGSGIKNATLFHNCNVTWGGNITNNYSNQTQIDAIFNVPIQDTAGCQWNVYFCDAYYNGSNCAFAPSNFTVKVDTTAPIVSFLNPTPNGDLFEPFSNIVINVSITEPSNDTVLLDWNGVNETLTQCTGKVNNTFTCWVQKNNLQIGVYSFQVFANDSGGYWGSTEIRNVTVSWNYTVVVQVDLDIMKNLVITNKTCISEDTLRIVWEEQHTLGGFTDYYQQVQNEFCDWGCDFLNKRCRTDPMTELIVFILFLIVIALTLTVPLILITRKSRKHKLKLMIDVTILLTTLLAYITIFVSLPIIVTFFTIDLSIMILIFYLVLLIFYVVLLLLFINNVKERRYV